MTRSRLKIDLSSQLAGRSIYWLAKESGVPYATVHKIATDKTDGIRFVILEKLAQALNCDARDLIGQRMSSGAED